MANDAFHLTKAAAEKYQNHSVPAMFEPLARATLEKVSLPDGASVIDIACGTGALTREITAKLPGRGHIAGTDLNATMIEVAQDQQPASDHTLEWAAADVSNMPFDTGRFDVGFVQQGLQFFPDKPAALAEIRRVLRPGGMLYVTCWRAVSGFNLALATALEAYVSEAAGTKAKAPFSFRDGDLITSLLEGSGFKVEKLDGIVLHRRFEDLRAQIMALPVEADLRNAGEDITDQVVADVARQLAPFDQGGVFIVPQEAHLFLARAV